MIFYEYDSQRVYTGNSKEHKPKEPIPKNWTHIPPPKGPGVRIFDGTKWFTRSERPVQHTAPASKPEHKITVGEFFDRFGDQKYAILASDNPQVRALIQDVVVRKEVNLKDLQLAKGLQMLVDAGFFVDVEQILFGPPAEVLE